MICLHSKIQVSFSGIVSPRLICEKGTGERDKELSQESVNRLKKFCEEFFSVQIEVGCCYVRSKHGRILVPWLWVVELQSVVRGDGVSQRVNLHMRGFFFHLKGSSDQYCKRNPREAPCNCCRSPEPVQENLLVSETPSASVTSMLTEDRGLR